MPRFISLFLIASVASVLTPALGAEEDQFIEIFDGRTLDNWDGDPSFWRIEDGAITGQSTAENPVKENTFLIWRGGNLGDFELKLQYRIIGGNSGIQYRSFEVEGEPWRVGGYQADMEAGNNYSGILFGERFRGILANRGQKTVIGNDHKPRVVGSVGQSDEIQKKIKNEDWNDYHVIAKGFEFVHKINDMITCQCTDEDTEMRRQSGILALQLHTGPPMKVQFRHIRLKRPLPSDRDHPQCVRSAVLGQRTATSPTDDTILRTFSPNAT